MRAVPVIQNLLRLLAVIVLILGFTLWAHRGYEYVHIHIWCAIGLVLLLWILCGLGLAARAKPGLTIAGFILGALVLWFGNAMRTGQFATVFPGRLYEIARVLHFLIGISAIGIAEVLAKRIKSSRARP